ncbi:hypothetical protein [Lysobacter enzymogenes]|uniref:Lipoprotein n=1 Tax=Lysobacter enzymogenes TaxID=69 RepID=A0AAU9ALJ2_LYSEN|nr:hypothetical protein [Lysobacter enzymogenes]BAV99825.1 hypothetical protein LEN_4338 [Lysobacter enzymogenes]
MSGRRRARSAQAQALRDRVCDAVALMLFAAVLAGCVSAPRDGAFSSWWRKPVLAVAAANELDPGVDRRCLSGHEPAAAVVAFRVGRVPAYKQAFALPADANLRAGDEVWVRPRSCELEAATADRATN